jgi:hypothetical protein
MISRDLRNRLLLLLAAEFESYGFVLNKAQAIFTKRVPNGWQKFQLVFLVRSEGWEINPALLIRNDIVEKIYHKASYFEAKYHKTTATVGLPIEKLINNGYAYDFHNFQLHTESDLNPTFQGLITLFKEVAIPFFQQYDSLEKIDNEINKENGARLFTWTSHGSIGLVIAKLVGNSRYDQLEKKYRKYYEQIDNGFYLPEYEGVVRIVKDL